MKKILIIEDEISISMVLKAYLEREGFEVIQVYDGLKAIPVFEETDPDLVLLDVMLPGKEGWDILKDIREDDACPVIMLTALNDVDYRLSGFKSGADDYISKPFVAEEVVARVHAVLRRSSIPAGDAGHVHEFGSLIIDDQSYSVQLNREEISLTPRDLSLLIFSRSIPIKSSRESSFSIKCGAWIMMAVTVPWISQSNELERPSMHGLQLKGKSKHCVDWGIN